MSATDNKWERQSSRSGQHSGKSGAQKASGCCCGGFALLAVIVMIRWATATKSPDLDIPAKVSPSPNAFDTYQIAISQLANNKQALAAISTSTPNSLAQNQSILAPNKLALSTIRSGLNQPYYEMSVRSPTTQFPYYSRYREIARLLRVEAKAKAQVGDWNGSVNASLDCLQFATQIPNGGPLIGELVGIASEYIGRYPAWEAVNHLSSAECKAAIKRLESIIKGRETFADCLLEEQYMARASLKYFFSGSPMLSQLAGTPNGAQNIVWQLSFLIYSKEQIARNNQNYYEALISNSKVRYGLHPAAPPIPSDPVSKILSPVYAPAQFKDVECKTQDNILMVLLAIHAFKLEHGKLPESLNELSPVYLKQLPEDEFATSGTFKYRVEDGKFTLYSVGPDGQDDGGKPIDDVSKATAKERTARYRTEFTSKGDIVAGININ